MSATTAASNEPAAHAVSQSVTPPVSQSDNEKPFAYDFVLEIARIVKNEHLTPWELKERRCTINHSLTANYSRARVAHNARSFYTFYMLMRERPQHYASRDERAAPFLEAYRLAKESCNVDEKNAWQVSVFKDTYRKDVVSGVFSILSAQGGEWYCVTSFVYALLSLHRANFFPFAELYKDVPRYATGCILPAVTMRLYELNLLRVVAPEMDFGKEEFLPLDEALQHAFPLFHSIAKILFDVMPDRLREIDRKRELAHGVIKDLEQWGKMCVEALYEVSASNPNRYRRNENFTPNKIPRLRHAFQAFRTKRPLPLN